MTLCSAYIIDIFSTKLYIARMQFNIFGHELDNCVFPQC